MNKEEFIEELNKINIEVTQDKLEKLKKYTDYLKEYNKHTNLTSITEEKDIYLKHYYDSLTLNKVYQLTTEKVLDIGSGAGFPGMVLKIFFPNIKLTLLDSNNKKIIFLKELSKLLNFNDIEFINERAEIFAKNNIEKYDIVTSRAVSNLCILSELSLPLTKINGYFIPLKGSNEEEITESLYAMEELGGRIENKINFTLPIEHSIRNILLVKKVKKTPVKYPRQYSKILKNPLKKGKK